MSEKNEEVTWVCTEPSCKTEWSGLDFVDDKRDFCPFCEAPVMLKEVDER